MGGLMAMVCIEKYVYLLRIYHHESFLATFLGWTRSVHGFCHRDYPQCLPS